ncbi:monovalent cation/H(+) antiporter subunit G [Pseudenhygromyxa sp. WMMC2535]|uniref:monovalent cation/H(+) antiporter subunit G n=1 Tax=Pseudenhygromyxa sp. WMMC2535 TaxID=2712867 RepID=UPI00159632A9|nr:monovalent cation/H(+) antiporter subunit G [Pseudenhygromyxa sp. WMMC2535]NVB42411.1 monovalent cation/H(+) antiporter subunit G [Pseudenhygromyxa sp. WMMC2535]
MGPLEIVGTLCIAVGCVLALTGSVGVLRMPDFYSRLHPAGKSDTLAQGLVLFGLALFAGQEFLDLWLAEGAGGEHWRTELIGLANILLKLVLLSLLLFLTAPTATHAISKAARLDRHTQIPVEDDPAVSRVSEIPVDGDIAERLEEPEAAVFDVDDDPDRAEIEGQPPAEPQPEATPSEAAPSEAGDASAEPAASDQASDPSPDAAAGAPEDADEEGDPCSTKS